MIRLRCEKVHNPRDIASNCDSHTIELALYCAGLQAKMLVEHGRKQVPLAKLQNAKALHAAGIIELLAWDEDLSGRLKRIRAADLSLSAAMVLVRTGYLPRCFVPALVAPELSTHPVSASALLQEEFAAWLECGGLSQQLEDRMAS